MRNRQPALFKLSALFLTLSNNCALCLFMDKFYIKAFSSSTGNSQRFFVSYYKINIRQLFCAFMKLILSNSLEVSHARLIENANIIYAFLYNFLYFETVLAYFNFIN